jgi:hypothetical protein
LLTARACRRNFMKIRCALIGAFLYGTAFAQAPLHIDKGACPNEGCRYGERWVATKSVALLEAPNATAKSVAVVGDGEAVTTVTGEVHAIPIHFVVNRAHGEFSPGDEVLVYTYLGEGIFRLGHNGVVKEADLNFGPGGGGNGTRCETNPARCWGTLQDEFKSDWWVKVRTQGGLEGWVLGSAGFKRPTQH